MNRRDFILLSAFAGGCKSMSEPRSSAHSPGQVVDAGPAQSYSADGVYATFKDRGFFIVKNGGKLLALSSLCTHRRCRLDAESDRSFSCPCHGSTFDSEGKVVEGPAVRNLPALSFTINSSGHLLVEVTPA